MLLPYLSSSIVDVKLTMLVYDSVGAALSQSSQIQLLSQSSNISSFNSAYEQLSSYINSDWDMSIIYLQGLGNSIVNVSV